MVLCYSFVTFTFDLLAVYSPFVSFLPVFLFYSVLSVSRSVRPNFEQVLPSYKLERAIA
jgi:hypothetical protein